MKTTRRKFLSYLGLAAATPAAAKAIPQWPKVPSETRIHLSMTPEKMKMHLERYPQSTIDEWNQLMIGIDHNEQSKMHYELSAKTRRWERVMYERRRRIAGFRRNLP